MSKLFQFLDLETVSICNRRCPTCIRNSHPDKSKTESFFKKNLLPWNVIKEALDQCADLGFTGGVCLSHYNEPLLDDRLVQIAMLVKSYDMFSPIFLHTNGDKLHDVLAKGLDGFLDRIHISFYDEEGKEERAKWTKSLFRVTEVVNLTMSDHIPIKTGVAENHRYGL
jgi:molybdenum cofactor biosynthesis enzyme MoaA